MSNLYVPLGIILTLFGGYFAFIDLERIREIHKRDRVVPYYLVLKEILWGNMGVAIPLIFVGVVLALYGARLL